MRDRRRSTKPVDKYLETIRNYLTLCRVSNLPTVWTNVLCAVVLAAPGFSWPPFLLLAISLSLFYAGGMGLNDVCDSDADRIKKPFRPIPAGRISVRAALIFTGVLMLAALALLALAPHRQAGLAGLVLLLLIVLYDVSHKNHPASVLLMAACRFMVFVVSALAVAGTVGLAVGIAGAGQFVYILIISIVARREKSRARDYALPVVPLMIAAISLVDGVMMALLVAPAWLAAGIGGTLLTWFGQRYVKGD